MLCLGFETRGRRMEGADGSTKPRRVVLSFFSLRDRFVLFLPKTNTINPLS